MDFGRQRKDSTHQKELPSPMNPAYQLLAPPTLQPVEATPTNRNLSSRTSSSATNLSSTITPMNNEIVPVIHESPAAPEPSSLDIQEEKLSTSVKSLKFADFFLDIFSLTKHLLLNLRYMGITCCAVVEALLIKGYLAFLSKHIEYQFRTTSSHSSVYIGIISLFSVNIFSTLVLIAVWQAMSFLLLSVFVSGYFRHAIRCLLCQTFRYEWSTMCEILLYYSCSFICDLSRINSSLPWTNHR